MNKSRIILVVFILLAVSILWVQSTDLFRLKLAGYYRNNNDLDKTMHLYKKVLRKNLVESKNLSRDPLGMELIDIYSQRIESRLNSADANLTVSDFPDMDIFIKGINEYQDIYRLNTDYGKVLGKVDSQRWRRLIDEVKKRKVTYCIDFSQRYIRRGMWDRVKKFYTQDMAEYFNPQDMLERLTDFYDTPENAGIKEKIWGDTVYISLEDFEDNDSPKFQYWAGNTEPEVNSHRLSRKASFRGEQSEYLDISYKKRGFNYWAMGNTIPLDESLDSIALRLYVRSRDKFGGGLVLNIYYPESRQSCVIRSHDFRDINGWQEIYITEIYNKAKDCAIKNGWDIRDMYIHRVGIDDYGISNELWIDSLEMFIPS